MTERVETVEEFLARGGTIEVIESEVVEGRRPSVPYMEVDSRYAAWKNKHD